jgi:hypothetical protein
MLHRTRQLFIRQQTSVINVIRAHLNGFRRWDCGQACCWEQPSRSEPCLSDRRPRSRRSDKPRRLAILRSLAAKTSISRADMQSRRAPLAMLPKLECPHRRERRLRAATDPLTILSS